MRRAALTGTLMVAAVLGGDAFAARETSFTQEDRALLIRLEATVQTGFAQIEKRFELIEKRFELIEKRFEQIEKRFESIERQLDRLVQIMIAVFVAQIGLVAAVIGFAYWDRRTIIGKAKEETVAEVEKEGRLRDLIHALRELSKSDQKLAKVLRDFRLL